MSWTDMAGVERHSFAITIKAAWVDRGPDFTLTCTAPKDDVEMLDIGSLYPVKFDMNGLNHEGDGVILEKRPSEDNPDMIEFKIRVDNSKIVELKYGPEKITELEANLKIIDRSIEKANLSQ